MKRLIAMAATMSLKGSRAISQTVQAHTTGAMSATDGGLEPMMRLSNATYARMALANEMRTVDVSRRTSARARLPAARTVAAAMFQEHDEALRDLSSIPRAEPMLGAGRASAIRVVVALRDARSEGFAKVQLDWQRHARALHSGYATDGPDPALRRFARAAVLRAEQDLRRLPMRPMPF